VKWEPYKPSQNGLCRKCNINQELKVQQLASFVPISKANFDEEIEVYRYSKNIWTNQNGTQK
jgi:Ima1 N-terminal domain